MYLYDKNRITYFAETDRRNKRIPFGIKAEDRTRHMYIIGKTGMGKSTMIENMAVQDIKNGEGLAFVDPHGKSAELLLDYIPPERIKDVIYFAPFDMDNPISFNIMEDTGADKRHLVANGLMSVFKKIWIDAWSARMEYILSNVLLALLEYPDSTLLGVNRVLTDKVYRKKVIDNVQDPSVKAFWVEEFSKYSEKYTQDATPAIQNKVGQFTSNPLIRNIIGQAHSSFDMRKIMDEKKILIVNLSKGQVGEGNASLLGSMIITKIYLSAMSRADLPESEQQKLPNFNLYVDEFQSFANESFANILSEARKYRLSLVMAHQYIEQMSEEVRAAVFGNVGTQIMFRVGATDAEILEKEYAPVFTAEDMVNLGFTQIYLKLMIDGVASHPFSAVTMPPIALPKKSYKAEVIASSRELFARPRAEVEKAITEWYGIGMGGEIGASVESPRERRAERREDRSPYERRERALSSYQDGVPRSTPIRTESRATVHASEYPARPPSSHESREVHPPKRREEQERVEKPFAKAFKEMESEIPSSAKPLEPVSLSSLAKNSPEKGAIPPFKSKGPTPGNVNNLKAALADVLSKKEHAESSHKKEASAHKKEESKPLQNFATQNLGGQAREVPEDVLRSVLRGED